MYYGVHVCVKVYKYKYLCNYAVKKENIWFASNYTYVISLKNIYMNMLLLLLSLVHTVIKMLVSK